MWHQHASQRIMLQYPRNARGTDFIKRLKTKADFPFFSAVFEFSFNLIAETPKIIRFGSRNCCELAECTITSITQLQNNKLLFDFVCSHLPE